MLTLAARRRLRAAAHPLQPVVLIGAAGLTAAVLKETDRALTSHELIKVRAHTAERDERETLLAEICEALDAQPVQHIGRILVIYRENPDRKMKPSPRAGRTKTKAARDERVVRRRSQPRPAASGTRRPRRPAVSAAPAAAAKPASARARSGSGKASPKRRARR
ncbi:MAG TPA: ribosome assembly RNA-binding protein YhbY [Burkholderiales bacterium]|nr:ribosome assembly RNA-binding protein YhbY [Burkholderiales bacterium]